MAEYDPEKTEKLLKRLEGDSYKPYDPSKPPEKPKSDDEDDPGFLYSAARGAGKEAASLVTGAGSLANKAIGLVSPKTKEKLSEAAESSPTIRRMEEFGAEPYRNIGETVGGIGTDIASGFAIPAGWLGRAAAAGLGRILPKVPRLVPGFTIQPRVAPVFSGGEKGFTSSVEHVPVFTPKIEYATSPMAGKLGKAAGVAGAGAAGGAIANPEDPETGAITGAIGGTVPTAIGRGIVTPVARYASQHLLPSLGSTAAYMGLHAMGLPGAVAHALSIPNIRWHSSPIGKRLSRIGPKIVDHLGNLVGTIEGAPSGTVASELQQSASPEEVAPQR